MLWTGSGKILHSYQCTHEGSRGICTAPADTLEKWLYMQNTDPDITTLFTNSLLYITGEVNDLPQFPNSALHFDIIRIIWPSIILDLIPNSLALTQQTYLTHTGIKITGLK